MAEKRDFARDFNQLVCEFYKVQTPAEALEKAVERMKQEVVAEATIHRPAVIGCTTFSELHDHFDANELGGFCDDGFPLMCDDDDCCRFTNAAQDAVHEWLAAGGLTNLAQVLTAE